MNVKVHVALHDSILMSFAAKSMSFDVNTNIHEPCMPMLLILSAMQLTSYDDPHCHFNSPNLMTFIHQVTWEGDIN